MPRSRFTTFHHSALVAIAMVMASSAFAGDSHPPMFSADFRRKADSAAAISDTKARIHALKSLIAEATPMEVLRFLPILFPPKITRSLQSSNLCMDELADVKAVYARFPHFAGSERAFADIEISALRPAANKLVECSGKFYRDGFLDIAQ